MADTKKEAAAKAEAKEEKAAAKAETDAAEKATEEAAAVEVPAEEPKGEGPSGWFHDVDHDSNLARRAAQHARDIAAGAPDDLEDSTKSRPGMRPK